jgi:hypothetical protein
MTRWQKRRRRTRRHSRRPGARAAWAGGVVAAGLLALYLPAWADATWGKDVERAEVVDVATLPEAQSNACTTIEVQGSKQPKVERHPKYEITWRSLDTPAGQPTRFTGYSCDRYLTGDERSVIRGSDHRVTMVNWFNANVYRVVFLCLAAGTLVGIVVFIALPRAGSDRGAVI